MRYPNISKLRYERKKKQVELAKYLNIRQTTYSKYERGVITPPIDVFIKLADFYNVTIDYLAGREERENNGKDKCSGVSG